MGTIETRCEVGVRFDGVAAFERHVAKAAQREHAAHGLTLGHLTTNDAGPEPEGMRRVVLRARVVHADADDVDDASGALVDVAYSWPKRAGLVTYVDAVSDYSD
jgi:hypothetical protein